MTRPNVAVQWWRRRTLHARLSLLVTGAVAVAVVTLAALAFWAVAEIQEHQIAAQLRSDAAAIAEQPDQWPTVGLGPSSPDSDDHEVDDHHRPADLGTRWQVLDGSGSVVSHSATLLPVTTGAWQVAVEHHRPVQERVTIDGDSYLMLTVPANGGGAAQVAINEEPATSTLTVFGLLLAAGCVLGIGGAAVLGRSVARAGLAPVQRLTEAVEEVAITTDLQHPIPVHGADEIARLGRSVNTMLGAIDTARRAQRTLVEDASHELRTPLTSIRTNIELLLAVENQPGLAHRFSAEDRANLLRDLDAQVGELSTLTTELVELAREETAREAVVSIDLADVVVAAVDRVRIRAARVKFDVDVAPVTVPGRPSELERMVVNVLDNAAKWSPPDADVTVHLRADATGWGQLSVADVGPGIDEADRPFVFDRFYRATAARAMPGSGLGLAIVAQTVGQHGGTVTVEPNTPHGTLVTIRLPPTAAE